MYNLVLLFTIAALLCTGCRAANVDRQMKFLTTIDNSIEPNGPIRNFVNFKRRPKPAYQLKSDAVLELTCDGIGSPAPTVHWFKNDAPVYEYDQKSNEVIDSSPSLARVSSTLLVQSAGKSDRYTCLLTAGSKTILASTTVYGTDGSEELSERAKLFPLKPRIVVSYKVIMAFIGNTVVLPCQAKGHPKPHISWTDKKGNEIENKQRMRVLRTGELVISSLSWDDLGDYRCTATNSFGSQSSHTWLYPILEG